MRVHARLLVFRRIPRSRDLRDCGFPRVPYKEGVNVYFQLPVEHSNGPFWADWDGTVLEQRGRNRWQTFGSPDAEKWLELRETVATGCHRLLFESHGKEGVSGSSPEEGSHESPADALKRLLRHG